MKSRNKKVLLYSTDRKVKRLVDKKVDYSALPKPNEGNKKSLVEMLIPIENKINTGKPLTKAEQETFEQAMSYVISESGIDSKKIMDELINFKTTKVEFKPVNTKEEAENFEPTEITRKELGRKIDFASTKEYDGENINKHLQDEIGMTKQHDGNHRGGTGGGKTFIVEGKTGTGKKFTSDATFENGEIKSVSNLVFKTPPKRKDK